MTAHDTPAEIPEAVRRKVLGLVGLGVRGRLSVAGTEMVREQARRGALRLAIVATDASRHSRDKVIPLLRAKQVTVLEWPSAAELGGVVGRAATAAVGIVDDALARGIRDAVGLSTQDGTPRHGARAAHRRMG